MALDQFEIEEGVATPVVTRVRPLRVLVLTPDFPPIKGGIQTMAERLLCSWHDVEARVVTSAPGHVDSKLEQQVRRVGMVGPAGRRGALARLNVAAMDQALRYRPDVVLSWHIVCGPSAVLAKRLLGIPYVQYLHGQEVAARRRLATFVTSNATAVIAVSRHTASLIQGDGAFAGRLNVIPPGVDIPRLTDRRRDKRPTVVTVARLRDRYKGHDILIQALPAIRSAVPDVRWVVVGEGPEKPTYERMVREAGLAASVTFVGSVDDAEREEWLDRSHVFAMPSRLTEDGRGEGFGIVYLEAGSHQLPVVAGDVAGARDAVIDGLTGRLVNPSDPTAVAGAITELLLNPELAATMGREGRKRAEEVSWPNIADRVRQVLVTASAARGRR